MKPWPMKFCLYPALMIFLGVISAEIAFTGLVGASNHSLYKTLSTLSPSGYVMVPNALIMPTLKQPWPAMWGALFFALTVGAGLSMTGLAAAALLDCCFKRFRPVLGVKLLLALAVMAVFLGFRFHFNPGFTLACMVPLAVVFALYARWRPRAARTNRPGWPVIAGLHLAGLAIIVAAWMPVMNMDLFVSFRDRVLLTHPAGRMINDFYYRYTLYPAEVFKPLDQKLLKSCRIIIGNTASETSPDSHPVIYPKLKQLLAEHDYLAVSSEFAPQSTDLAVHVQGGALNFHHKNKRVHTCEIAKFINDPKSALTIVSEKTDNAAFLRTITFLSLVAASPLLCYVFMHTVFLCLFFFIGNPAAHLAAATAGCVLFFSLPAMLFYHAPIEALNKAGIHQLLRAPEPEKRVLALRAIDNQDRRINRFIDPEIPAQSPWIAERYWLAKTLGNDPGSETRSLILRLLDDPHPNVACMAYHSLGRNSGSDGKNAVIETIIRRISTSGHWYVQWYAYKALKRLGWTQKPLAE